MRANLEDDTGGKMTQNFVLRVGPQLLVPSARGEGPAVAVDGGFKVAATISCLNLLLGRQKKSAGLSGLGVERFLQSWNNSDNWAVPKDRGRLVFPACVRCVQNRVIPVEAFLNAAAQLRRGFLLNNLI